MTNILRALIVAMTVAGIAPLAGAGEFQSVKTKTFAKEKFVFPGDIGPAKLNLFFLAMSDDQDSGQAQQQALLDWHAALAERGVFSDDVVPYHFPVMEGVPFFVKGIVSGAMTDIYEGKVPLGQAAPLFIKDLEKFAAGPGLPLDGEPTIVIVSSAAQPLEFFKGEVSPDGVERIADAIAGRLAE
jgi:hypothetical protein